MRNMSAALSFKINLRITKNIIFIVIREPLIPMTVIQLKEHHFELGLMSRVGHLIFEVCLEQQYIQALKKIGTSTHSRQQRFHLETAKCNTINKHQQHFIFNRRARHTSLVYGYFGSGIITKLVGRVVRGRR